MSDDESLMMDSPQELLKDVTPGYCDVQSFVPVAGGYAGHCTCGAWDVVMSTHEEVHAAAVQHTKDITRREMERRLAEEQATSK